MADTKQPDALRLADRIQASGQFTELNSLDEAAVELRRLHAENEQLRAGYDAARLEIASLHTQMEAVGAGGMEPLRKRCLHQISEPAQAVGADQANAQTMKAVVHDAVMAASIRFISRLTGMVPPPLECAPPEVTAPFKQFADDVIAAIGATAPQSAAQALDAIVDLAQEAHRHWDADRDAKVGKLLMALSGYSPGYDKRADALHAAIAAQKGVK